MPFYEHRDIQFSPDTSWRDYLRDLNGKFKDVAKVINNNRRGTSSVISFNAPGNATYPFFISDDRYDITDVWYYSSGAAGTMSLDINGVAVTGSSQTPSATATSYQPTAANELSAGDRLSLVTSGTSGQTMVSVILRRLT